MSKNDFEGIDMSEMQHEFARLSADPTTTNNNSDFLEKFVRLPEKDGYVLMRILPRKKGVAKHYCVTRVHTLNNPTTGSKKTYHCPKTLVKTEKGDQWKGDCIICKYYGDLWQKSEGLSGKDQQDMQNDARKIKPVERYYYNVIVRDEFDPKTKETKKNSGPKIYSCGKTTHAKIVRAIWGDELAGEKALGDITHPITGRDFRVVKKIVKGGGGQEYPNYDKSKFEDVSPAGSPDEIATWIENLHDLQALRVLKTPDELKHALRVHLGMVKEGDAAKDDELLEFRAASAGNQPSPARPPEPIREELVTRNTASSNTTSQSSSADDVLADDDFMNELAGM